MGRMGTLHAWQTYDGVPPDIQAVAKGLGGGYASIGAVFMSPKITKGIRDASGFWKHGHTYQAHPLACAAALAVQNVIESENLLENCRTTGSLLEKNLQEALSGPNKLASPYVFDIRGQGGFWAIEFDVDQDSAPKLNLKGQRFALLVQARALQNGLIVMGFTGGSELAGVRGDHIVLAPPYNVTAEEVQLIVQRLVTSVEEVIKEHAI